MNELTIPPEMLEKLINDSITNNQLPRFGNYDFHNNNYTKSEIDLMNIQVTKDIAALEKKLSEIDKRIDEKIDYKLDPIKNEIENKQLKKLDSMKNWIMSTCIGVLALVIGFLYWLVKNGIQK